MPDSSLCNDSNANVDEEVTGRDEEMITDNLKTKKPETATAGIKDNYSGRAGVCASTLRESLRAYETADTEDERSGPARFSAKILREALKEYEGDIIDAQAFGKLVKKAVVGDPAGKACLLRQLCYFLRAESD
jgi:hypothetical protein